MLYTILLIKEKVTLREIFLGKTVYICISMKNIHIYLLIKFGTMKFDNPQITRHINNDKQIIIQHSENK